MIGKKDQKPGNAGTQLVKVQRSANTGRISFEDRMSGSVSQVWNDPGAKTISIFKQSTEKFFGGRDKEPVPGRRE